METKAENKPRIGRPPAFSSPEELQAKIDEYFEKETGWMVVGTKNVYRDGDEVEIEEKRYRPATLSGLAYALGVCRDLIWRYSKDDAFKDVLARAKTRCERDLEEGALNGELNPQFAKHVTQNGFGWKDKTEVDQTVRAKVDLSKTSSEELLKMLEND